VKLSDYGISQFASINGVLGLAGTPGFIAPEILKYNGKEVYTNKVYVYAKQNIGGVAMDKIANIQSPNIGTFVCLVCMCMLYLPIFNPSNHFYSISPNISIVKASSCTVLYIKCISL